MFLIMLHSNKSGVASSCCCKIWDVCGNTFFTCWRSADWPWKSFFRVIPLETHFWGVLEAKNAVQPNSYTKGRGHLILNFQWPVWWNLKSFFYLFPLEIHFWGVLETKNAVQPNSYSKGRGFSFWIFSDQFDGISSHFSIVFPLEIHFWGVLEAKNAQFNPIHTQRGGDLILNFQWPVWWNSKSFFSLFTLWNPLLRCPRG